MTGRTASSLAGCIALAALAAWLGAWHYASHVRGPPPPPVTTLASALKSPPEALTSSDDSLQIGPISTKIPATLPKFALSDLHGEVTSVDLWRGKSLIINFWATWCTPCRREIPLLKKLAAQWAARNVEVIGVAVDYREKVAAYAGEMGIGYPLLVGEQDALDVATALGVESPVFPFTVFTDRHGDVVALYVGELHQAQADLILAAVENLNSGRSNLAAARHSIVDGLHGLRSDPPT